MNNVIFLIGNGFDLNHKLETSYSNFLVWYLRKSLETASETNKPYDDNCFFIEVTGDSAMVKLNEAIDKEDLSSFMYDRNLVSKRLYKEPFYIKPKNDFVKELLMACFNCEWNGIEAAIYSFIKSQYQYLSKDIDQIVVNRLGSNIYNSADKKINSLNKSIDQIKTELHNYLKSLDKPLRLNHDFLNKVLLEHIKYNPVGVDQTDELTPQVLFLNFNYTVYHYDIIAEMKRLVYTDEIFFNAVNIHGSVDNVSENLVFGIGDEQNDFYNQIEMNCGDNWLKSAKSFDYLKNEKYRDLVNFIESGQKYDIYVLGHSCSTTDRTLLNMVFDNKNCSSISVVHHDGLKSYMKTAYNISRNFKDKVKMRSVLQPYNTKLAW